MWLLRTKIEANTVSSASNLNFLFNHNKIYIMDNHLAAAWAWAQKVDSSLKYNLLHIDKHADLIDNPQGMQKLRDNNISIKDLCIFQYCNLKNGDLPMFNWANSILNFNTLYNNIFRNRWFAIYESSYPNEDFITRQISNADLINTINCIADDESKWIINLDIDYFFDNQKQVLSDSYISNLVQAIKSKNDLIQVITIALSPECCYGWDNAIRIANKIAIEFNFSGFNIALE